MYILLASLSHPNRPLPRGKKFFQHMSPILGKPAKSADDLLIKARVTAYLSYGSYFLNEVSRKQKINNSQTTRALFRVNGVSI